MSNTPERMSFSRPRLWALLAGIAVFALSGWAAADPPARAARLAYTSGAVSFSPGGEDDWVLAPLNRPLTSGDRLWADADSRAEVQLGGAALRMGANTSVTLLNLDDSIAQVQLSEGTLKIRVRRLGPGQAFEVDTPNLAFTLRRPGEYRIEVDPAGDATAVIVQSGQGEVYGDGASYVVDSRRGYRFAGTGLRDYQPIEAPRDDDFDRWASERDRRGDNSASARYVSSDVVGYEDLDGNGSWRTDPGYGNVWVPNSVAAGWTPYQEGHWAWVDPWGWTWVDDAPWGYAVSHYGRWANLRGTWGWVPGPVTALAVYAPALVAFIGGSNFQVSNSLGRGGAVAWFPLAPRDVYRPSYAASRGYFDRINRSNTVINTTTITNVYNTTNVTKIVYANRQVPGAVVAVPTSAFVHAQPVAKAAVRVSKEALVSAAVSAVAAVAPVQQSVHGAAAPGRKPPSREHAIVARSAPPAAALGLAAQQQQLAARPGRPLDEAVRRQLKPLAPVTTKVGVIATAQARPPTAPPPPPARSTVGGGRPDQAKAPATAPAPGPSELPRQSTRPTQRNEAANLALPPRVERAPVTPQPSAPPAAAPSAAITQAPQQARPAQRDEAVKPAPPPRVERAPPTSPPIVTPAAPPSGAVTQAPQQAARPTQRDDAIKPARLPRIERAPLTSPPTTTPAAPPSAAVAPQQAARPTQRDEAVKPAPPPRVERAPPTSPPVATPAAPPSAATTQTPQRARPEPRVPAIPPAAVQVTPPPPVRPAAPAAQAAQPPPVRPAAPATQASQPPPQAAPAAQPAQKPSLDASKSAERKKAEEENRK